MSSYRPITEDEQETVARHLQYGFMLTSGPDPEAYGDVWKPELFDLRGIDDGDELVSVCKRYHMAAWVRNEFRTIGGLGAVATPPEHRRQGYIRQLLEAAVDEYHEEGVGLVTLWPSTVPFYRNLGWAVTNKYTNYEIPPSQLAFARGTEGQLTPLDCDDLDRIQAVETEWARGTNLAMQRSQRWWTERTLSDWAAKGKPYLYGYERGGELRGFVRYTVSDDDDGRRMQVPELVATDQDSRRGLLAFLANHDSQVETIELYEHVGTGLLDQVEDPHELECSIHAGPMVRLTSVVDPLERYPWPADSDATFTLAVEDPLCGRLDRSFEVELDAGEASVDPLAQPVDDPDVTVDVQTLSQLYIGRYGLPEARRYGSITVEDDLEGLFTMAFLPEPVCLQDFF